MIENTPNTGLDELISLHKLRFNMQQFCQNPDNEDARNDVLTAYESLLKDELLRTKINEAIQEYIIKQVTMDDFNYFQFKTSSEKEDQKRRSTANKSKTKNNEISLIKKQLAEEIAFQAGKKAEFNGLENAEITSVSLKDKAITINIKDSKEPLIFSCSVYKGKKISPLGWAAVVNKKPQKSGLTNKVFGILEECGEQGYVLQDAEKPDDLGKKYSPSEYKKFLGIARDTELTKRQKNELEFLNKLTISDQNSFLVALKKRLVLLKKHKEIADFTLNTEDNLGLLSNLEPLQSLLKKNELNDFTAEMQKQFILFIQKDKNIWNNFSKKGEENSQRFSQYEILQNNLIARNQDIFKEAYDGDFTDTDKAKLNLTKCFTTVRHLAEPNLSDELCAEIIAQGIFKEAINTGTDKEKLSKMNILLNEMGINIDFKSLPVTKAPPVEISGAAEQTKLDRQNFEELKRSAEYVAQDAEFSSLLTASGITKPVETSTHHYIALKYNPFIETELNNNSLLVKTAKANAWNYDGHDTTHLYDTAGEFLIKNERDEYSLADFNRLRDRFNKGEKLEIQAPVLQIKDEETDKYRDLLALGENGQSGHYISDNTTTSIIKVPGYCHSGIIRAIKLKLEQQSSKTSIKK